MFYLTPATPKCGDGLHVAQSTRGGSKNRRKNLPFMEGFSFKPCAILMKLKYYSLIVASK